MIPPLCIVDGSKSVRFDGLVLDVSGLDGTADVKRATITNIERIGVEAAGEEWLFLVRLRNGGFSLVISTEKKAEWEALAHAVREAQKGLPTEAADK